MFDNIDPVERDTHRYNNVPALPVFDRDQIAEQIALMLTRDSSLLGMILDGMDSSLLGAVFCAHKDERLSKLDDLRHTLAGVLADDATSRAYQEAYDALCDAQEGLL